MTGVEVALAVSAAAAAASAYVSYEGSRNQGKLGRYSENIKQEQLAMERRTSALQAREQEAERLRRAGIARSANQAAAGASGLDWWLSPSLQAAAAEDDRLVAGDVSSIRLLGAAGQRRSLVESRVSEVAESGYGAMGSNAWIGPSIGFVQSAASAYRAGGATGGGGGGTTGVEARPEALTGRYPGPR
jgi:hypothetical protein